MALPKIKADATDARLAALTLPDGAGWATEARQSALSRVAAMGLPIKRDEYWRYTDPTSLTSIEAPDAAVFESDEAPVFNDLDRLKIVFVDGVFDAEASDDLSLNGV